MTPPKPFTTDGCSGFMTFVWRVLWKKVPPWEGCCEEHDRAYWEGGPNSLRLAADIKVYHCVKTNGHPIWAVIMFVAVRLGGMWWLPFPSLRQTEDGKWHFSLNEVRWGYGWPYPQRGLEK